jgi:hypothetical protein
MSTTVAAAVLALAGVAVVVAVSWVFYRVGRAEDRDREREEAEAARLHESNGDHRTPGTARERRRPLPPRRP